MTFTRQESDAMITACMSQIQWEHHTSRDEWQFYVGDHTRRIWNTLSFNQKEAIAIDAHALMERTTMMAIGDYL